MQFFRGRGVVWFTFSIHFLFALLYIPENEELMMNPNCRQIIFMDYLRTKCQYDKGGK